MILHHGSNADFSRWIEDVLRDTKLAMAVRAIEERVPGAATSDEIERLRRELLETIETHYL